MQFLYQGQRVRNGGDKQTVVPRETGPVTGSLKGGKERQRQSFQEKGKGRWQITCQRSPKVTDTNSKSCAEFNLQASMGGDEGKDGGRETHLKVGGKCKGLGSDPSYFL